MSQASAPARRPNDPPPTTLGKADHPPPPTPSVHPRRNLSRRRLLGRAAGVGAFWGGAAAQAQSSRDVSADVDPGSLLTKLVRRITLGLTEPELASAASLGYTGYLERHLNYTAIDDSALNARLVGLNTLTMPVPQLAALPAGQVINELTEATILRSVLSARQLFERMVEFWTDHFNIDIRNGADQFLKTPDDRDVVRQHALGTFPALLSASAHSPAMLFYLDNNTSIAGSPNENYARELMELHTMGADGGYTQQDVQEVARCLTGWTLYQPLTSQPLGGSFRFTPARHDNGQKIVLGQIIPAGGGIQDGLTVLSILANHPSTARFIAGKLCRWLLAEGVSQSVIDSVAATYTATGGDIKAMVRTALAPNVLYDAAPKYKRPYHLYVSAMRALPTTIAQTSALRGQLTAAGHRPFYWSPPDGYPDTLQYWSGLILPRWNFGALLLNGNLAGVSVNVTAFLAGATSAQAVVDRIDAAMFGGEMPPADRDRLRTYLLPDPPPTTRIRDAIGLAIGSPGFQWH